MSTQLLERPEVAGISGGKFCHATCKCSPTMTLCGAYKPKLCGISVLATLALGRCPKCEREFCPDCDYQLDYPCLRCGE